MYIILGFAISDQHANLSSIRSHPNILLEIVVEDVVQSHACNEDINLVGECACRIRSANASANIFKYLSWYFLLCREV